MFDKLICAISIICLAVVLVLVIVLKDSLRTYFKSLSWFLGVRSLSLRSQVQEVLVLVLGGQVLVLVLVLGGKVLVIQRVRVWFEPRHLHELRTISLPPPPSL